MVKTKARKHHENITRNGEYVNHILTEFTCHLAPSADRGKAYLSLVLR